MGFDRIAPYYRLMEWLAAGSKLQRCRKTWLDEIPVPVRVLLAGEGHGKFLPECVQKFPEAQILVLDSSDKMLEIARSHASGKRVNFIQTDILVWDAPEEKFDLVVTHFFLDCFTGVELPRVVEKLARAATLHAHWLLSDFEVAPAGWARWRSKWIVALLYRFFNLVSGLRANALIPPDSSLEHAGFRRHRRREYEWGLLKAEWWFRETQETGVKPFQ